MNNGKNEHKEQKNRPVAGWRCGRFICADHPVFIGWGWETGKNRRLSHLRPSRSLRSGRISRIANRRIRKQRTCRHYRLRNGRNRHSRRFVIHHPKKHLRLEVETRAVRSLSATKASPSLLTKASHKPRFRQTKRKTKPASLLQTAP